VLSEERFAEFFKSGCVFRGEDFEVAVLMAREAVNGVVLRGDGARLGRFGAG